MNDLLNDLKGLLYRHDAVILRSANEIGNLVLCKKNQDSSFTEIEFQEDITVESITYGWHSPIKPQPEVDG